MHCRVIGQADNVENLEVFVLVLELERLDNEYEYDGSKGFHGAEPLG